MEGRDKQPSPPLCHQTHAAVYPNHLNNSPPYDVIEGKDQVAVSYFYLQSRATDYLTHLTVSTTMTPHTSPHGTTHQQTK